MTDGEAELGQRVDRATDALDRVRDSIDNEAAVREQEVAALSLKFVTAAEAAETANRAVAKTRRNGRWVIVAIALALLAVSAGLVSKYRSDQTDERERVRQAVVACNNANLSRAAILAQFDVFITLLGSAGNPPPTPEAAASRRELIEKFRQDFHNGTPQALKPRDCSVKAVMSPTPLPTSTTAVVG